MLKKTKSDKKLLEQLIKQVSLLNEISHKLKELCRELNSSLKEQENW